MLTADTRHLDYYFFFNGYLIFPSHEKQLLSPREQQSMVRQALLWPSPAPSPDRLTDLSLEPEHPKGPPLHWQGVGPWDPGWPRAASSGLCQLERQVRAVQTPQWPKSPFAPCQETGAVVLALFPSARNPGPRGPGVLFSFVLFLALLTREMTAQELLLGWKCLGVRTKLGYGDC